MTGAERSAEDTGNAPHRPWQGDQLYLPDQKKQLATAGLYLGLGFVGVIAARDTSGAESGLLVMAVIGFTVVGLMLAIRAFLRYPRLKVSAEGLVLDLGYSQSWANWNSLGPFKVEEIVLGRSVKIFIEALITGDMASADVMKSGRFRIPNQFDRSPEEIIASFPVGQV